VIISILPIYVNKSSTSFKHLKTIYTRAGRDFLYISLAYTNQTSLFLPLLPHVAYHYTSMISNSLRLADFQYADNKGFAEDLTEGKFSFPVVHGVRADTSNRQLLRESTPCLVTLPSSFYHPTFLTMLCLFLTGAQWRLSTPASPVAVWGTCLRYDTRPHHRSPHLSLGHVVTSLIPRCPPKTNHQQRPKSTYSKLPKNPNEIIRIYNQSPPPNLFTNRR